MHTTLPGGLSLQTALSRDVVGTGEEPAPAFSAGKQVCLVFPGHFAPGVFLAAVAALFSATKAAAFQLGLGALP